jgi:pyruvate dehydrogenase E1 component alpha subunit/2-oxoisovalerate dehydrogenase E1 component alpha subunit
MMKRSTPDKTYRIRKPDSLRIDREGYLELYRFISLNRRIDERLSILYRQNHIVGGLYSSLGQEATSVGSAYALLDGDFVAAMIRDIGALLVRGVNPREIISQYCARGDSPTGGRDLNLHFGAVDKGIIAPISVVGALVPVMAGIALEISLRKKKSIAMTYIGDGAMSTTDFHEGINFAAVRRLPFVLIVENNGYAYSTPTSRQANVPDLAIRAAAYGIYGETVDGNNVLAVLDATRRARERCLAGEGPVLIEAKTFRRKGHAEHDDAGYVPEKLRIEWEARDPLESYRRYLTEKKIVESVEELTTIDDKIEAELQETVRDVLEAPFPEPDTGQEDVYA